MDPERRYAVGLRLKQSEIVGVVVDLLDRSRIPREDLLGVGIGLGGHVNGPLGMPVVVGNDVNVLAVAEQAGQALGASALSEPVTTP